MGIQINGTNDTISASDGSLSVAGQQLTDVTNINATGIVTATTYVVGTGSTSAPSITPSGDSNTGIFFPSADTIAFGEGGAEVARIDSSGRLLVGTSSFSGNATQVLHGQSGGATAHAVLWINRGSSASSGDAVGTIRFADSSANQYAQIDCQADATTGSGDYPGRLVFSTTADGASSVTERMRIDSSGRMGLGTTSPQRKLVASNAGAEGIEFGPGESSNRNLTLHYNRSTDVFVLSENRASQHTFLIGADEAARIDASKRLLVGTSSSRSNDLFGESQTQIEGTTAPTSSISVIRNSNNAGSGGICLAKTRGSSAGSATVVQSGDPLGFIDFEGADGTSLKRAASIACEVDATPGTNDMPGRLVFSTTKDGASSPTEAMRIDNAGNLLLRKTSASRSLGGTYFEVPTDPSTMPVYLHFCKTFSGTRDAITFNYSASQVGSIQFTDSGTSYNTSSDYRLKKNVVPLTGAADRVNQLQVHRFNFIADPDKTVDGFLAHEAQAVVPECVTGEKDAVDDDGNPVYQGIDQSKLVPLLTAALQEALAEIESLKARVTALEP